MFLQPWEMSQRRGHSTRKRPEEFCVDPRAGLDGTPGSHPAPHLGHVFSVSLHGTWSPTGIRGCSVPYRGLWKLVAIKEDFFLVRRSFLFLSAFPVLGVTSSRAPSSTPSRSTMLESPAGKFLLQSARGAKGRGSYSESHLWGITFTMDTGPP